VKTNRLRVYKEGPRELYFDNSWYHGKSGAINNIADFFKKKEQLYIAV